MARRGGGRAARVEERTGADSGPSGPAFIRRKVMPYDLLTPDGLDRVEAKADQILAEIGIDINEQQDREEFRAAGASIDGTRVRFEPGQIGELVKTCPGRVHPARPQPGQVGRARWQQRGDGAGLRVAVRARPRRWAPLRLTRRLPQLHQAHPLVAVAASLGWHDLRTRRRAGQQAPPRHGVRPHQVQRSGVPRLGHDSRACPRLGRADPDPVRRAVRRRALRDHGQRQRQLAAGVGQRHDRCDSRLRRGQPGVGDRAVHPRRGDGARSRWPATSPKLTPKRWSASPWRN